MTGQSKITKHIEQRTYGVSTGADSDFRHPRQAHYITDLTHRLCRSLPRCVVMPGGANPGDLSNLEAHHTEFRSQSGDDSEQA
jgi:hypothetical protein